MEYRVLCEDRTDTSELVLLLYGYSLGLYVEKQQSKNKQKQIKVFEKMKRKGVEIYNKNILCI